MINGENAGEISEVTMDFEVEFNAGVGLVGFVAVFIVIFTSGGVEKVCVFNNMLNSGHERRYESFCRLLWMGGGGCVGGEGSLSLLLEK